MHLQKGLEIELGEFKIDQNSLSNELGNAAQSF